MVDDQRDRDEVAILETVRRAYHLRRCRRIERSDELAHRHGRNELAALISAAGSVCRSGSDSARAARPALNPDDRFAHVERRTATPNRPGQLLPHLARPMHRVAEAVDQSLDDLAVATAKSKRTLDQRAHREILDTLRRPVGADLIARNAPNVLGVALEESLVEAAAEGVDNPVLEAANLALRPHARREIAHHARGGLEQPELT